jgi:cytochrome b
MKVADQKESILVWDFPVRVFHWLLVISFAGAWLTSESEAQQMIHYAFGYSACALLVFRIIWGVVGTRYARFGQFIKGPKEILSHLKALLKGKLHLGLGHNPLGALAMVALMGLILLIGLTGYANVKEFLGDLMGEAHEFIATATLAIVVVHVAAAVIMSLVQKENLVKSMFTGRKQGLAEESIRFPQYLIGLSLMLAWGYFFYMVVSSAIPELTQ